MLHPAQPNTDSASELLRRSHLEPSRSRPAPREPRAKRLQLVGRRAKGAASSRKPTQLFDQPITGPTDPRWVLAVRTAQLLDGEVLTPLRRERLRQLGRILGLTPFAVSLIIAVVQDQARRGFAPEDCPTAGEDQLRLIPLPQRTDQARRTKIYTALGVAGLLAVELLLIQWWLLS